MGKESTARQSFAKLGMCPHPPSHGGYGQEIVCVHMVCLCRRGRWMGMSVTAVEKLQNEDEQVDYVQVQLNRRDNVVIWS